MSPKSQITPEQEQVARNVQRLIERHGLRDTRVAVPPEIWHCVRLTELDHLRLYRTAAGGVMLLCSNYDDAPPPATLGMEPHAPLYSLRCRSFVRLFTSPAAMRAVIREAAAHGRKGRL